MFRVYVGVSGKGRLLKTLFADAKDCGLYAVAGVFYTKLDDELALFLNDNKIPSRLFDPKDIWQFLADADLVCLAGFVKKFPLDPTKKIKAINIHPALLPKHGGHGMYKSSVHQSVLDSEDEFSGATVHFVNEDYDQGEIIAQSRVKVLADDTVDSLAQRVFAVEQKLYPIVVQSLVTKVPILKDKDGFVQIAD
jgi:folate-dependent phosphoribosylglycinamide formyltransferase PurN